MLFLEPVSGDQTKFPPEVQEAIRVLGEEFSDSRLESANSGLVPPLIYHLGLISYHGVTVGYVRAR